jgi:hypothetical protein
MTVDEGAQAKKRALLQAAVEFAIASERDQQAVLLKSVQMPLLTLACTAVDKTISRPDGYYRQEVLNDILSLFRRQEETWNDLYANFE